jgi:hypothetical protein
VLGATLRQAAKSNALAQEAAHHYLTEISTANRSQIAAFDALQHAVLHSTLDLQDATSNLSRSMVDAASTLNRALVQWIAAAISPWPSLGMLTEEAPPASQPIAEAAIERDEATRVGDALISALRFQGPMGLIASGLGEAGDA